MAAVLTAAILLSGCSSNTYVTNVSDIPESARLSKDDYKERLLETYQSWVKEVTYIAPALFGEDSGKDISEVPACAQRARAAIRDFGTFLPPKELDSYHDDILKSLSVERDWLDAAERAAEAKKNGDSAAFDAAAAEIQKYADESGFPDALFAMIHELNK